VQTVDYFTPVVDDPYDFGRIAAANALSDIYAMGARPLTALNIVGFPVRRLAHEVLGRILRGGAAKLAEAGCALVGGHSIDDAEPKYGLAVTGVVHPDRVVTNAGARAGDRLVLTKPIGVGVITTAIKHGLASDEVVAKVTEVMATLNRAAAEAMVAVGVSACTDVTGFGLLGHLSGMARASRVGFEVEAGAVPVLPEAWEFARAGAVPGGTRANLAFLTGESEERPLVTFDDAVSEQWRLMLADAVTSGGLLISVPAGRLDDLRAALKARGVETRAVVGRAVDAHPGRIRVLA
jgi:selenide,water dikinase